MDQLKAPRPLSAMGKEEDKSRQEQQLEDIDRSLHFETVSLDAIMWFLSLESRQAREISPPRNYESRRKSLSRLAPGGQRWVISLVPCHGSKMRIM